MPPATAAALTTAKRMGHRIFCRSTNMRPSTAMPHSARFAPPQILVIGVADLTNRRSTMGSNFPHFAGRKNQNSPFVVTRNKSCRASGTTCQLATLTDVQLYIMDIHTRRDVLHRHGIARLGLNANATFHNIAGLDAHGRQNIPHVRVGILNQRNMTRAIGIVFDALHRSDHTVFVSLEVNPPIDTAGTTSTMTRGDPTVVIATAVPGQSLT
jgi:hypothetical protein